MKVRFYCDIPSNGVRVQGSNAWSLCALTAPHPSVMQGYTRVAFDVDLPPNLVLPPHDVMATATNAFVSESVGPVRYVVTFDD